MADLLGSERSLVAKKGKMMVNAIRTLSDIK